MVEKRRSKPKGSIEGMKDSLYSRKSAPEIHTEDRTPLPLENNEPTPVVWSDSKIKDPEPYSFREPPNPKRMSFGAKFLIGSVVFFVVASGVAGYMLFIGGTTISPQNIDIQVLAPSVIDGGKAATFEVIVNNRNQSPLQLAGLTIDYPASTRDPADQSKSLTHDQQTIGAITAGEQIKRTASAVLYGAEGSSQKVLVTLQYSIPNSNAIFQKQAEADFTIGSSPVSVAVAAPAEAISNQSFSMDVTVTSNASSPIQNVVLEGQYPFGYSVTSATPKADSGGNLWRLGTLSPGQSKKITLVGTIVGQDGDQRVFKFLTGSDADQTDTTIKVPFITVPQTLTVHKPFITATLALNGESGATTAIQAGQTVNGTVTWQNNLTVPVSNVQIVMSLSGPMLDTTSVNSSNGFYQSQNNTLSWSKDQEPALATVAPGGTGSFDFSFKTLSPGAGGTVYANPTVSLDLSVSGVRQGQAGVPETVSSAATIQAIVASTVALQESALHFTGAFQNSGPMPPTAETTTTYTVVWSVSNSSNTIANTVVSATLPSYVQFVAGDPSITYDKSSRTVTWSLGDLKAGAGFSSAMRTGSFQVSLLPSASQVGQSPNLTGNPKLSGQDRFAQVVIDVNGQAATTALTGDAGYQDSMANVAPKQ